MHLGKCTVCSQGSLKMNLQVLKGSQRLGRIDHGTVGRQTGADMDRVNLTIKELPLVHVKMEPGDVLFFHWYVLFR